MLAIHPNARTTPAVRAEIARSQESWWPACSSTCRLSGASIGRIVKELLPFYAVAILVLALSYVPALTLRM